MSFVDSQDLVKIKNAAIHKMPILHYDRNGFRSSIRLLKNNNKYYNVHVTDEAMLEYIVTQLKETDKISVMGEFSIEHWKNRLGKPYHTTHIQAQYLQVNNFISFKSMQTPAMYVQFRLMVFLAQNLPDDSKVSTCFDAKTIDEMIRKVIVNTYPNDKKRHSVNNLKAARDKVRKILHGQRTLDLQRIQQGNMQMISKLTESSK
ncbi:hypothetical protein HMPREF1544_10069 [Mucor circinelloides 1006PhL]|uniref:Uncharacterized protein n=1 Tax=Mucor circinelloides f. circinelloides (strain 1006PhL) TaxID=1220926 RepID=S2IZH9_MUCC1|nr:hypothetical protein HMPREF1544_10069 [Mucor circinelloides 1006PhL]